MSVLDSLRRLTRIIDATTTVSPGTITYWGIPTSIADLRGYIGGLSPEDLYKQQPHLRTVISFLARNGAHLGIHTFARLSDTDRERVTDDPVAMTLKKPNKHMTGYDLVYRLISDWALYDDALWLVTEDLDAESGWVIQPIPLPWVVGYGGGDLFGPAHVKVSPPGSVGKPLEIDMDSVIRFHGWNPKNLSEGDSPVNALKATLSEQMHAVVYREQQWKRSGRVGMVVSRPKEAPRWTADQKRKFKEILDSKLSGDNGADASGSVVLEDGMDAKRLGFNAKEEQFVEAAKLGFNTVCSVYHVNPTMVGMLDNANFSNVKEFSRMLYTVTMGPILKMIEDRLNAFLVPRIGLRDDLYVEFNIEAKMKGSFEEQAAVLSSATGRPWQTVNETRARLNMSEIEGGDELVIPLNVLVGGQASPRDSTPDSVLESPPGESALSSVAVKRLIQQQVGKQVGQLVDLGEKERAPDTYQTNVERVLKAFFKRQGSVVLSALGAKAGEDWWDEARWNRELAADLFRLAKFTADQIGAAAAVSMGFDEDDYDAERTVKFLQAVAVGRAEAINGATKRALDEALGPDATEDTPSPSEVFQKAENNRSVTAAAALVTMFSAFGTTEAAKQLAPTTATKTWVVNSKDPRAEHASMNGETVPVGEKFSNGADWPGDPVLGADGVAGCKCSVTVRTQ